MRLEINRSLYSLCFDTYLPLKVYLCILFLLLYLFYRYESRAFKIFIYNEPLTGAMDV